MNPDVTKMTPKEFAEWWNANAWEVSNGKNVHYETALSSAIAARDRVLLEAAADRAYNVVAAWLASANRDQVTAAILGEPRFKPGQLVRWKGLYRESVHKPSILYGPYDGNEWMDRNAEPVIDRNGNPVYLPVDEAEA